MTPDLAPFFAAIDAAPEDSLRVGLLADYLEERGHEWGPPMRWAYLNGKRPERYAGAFTWWCTSPEYHPEYSRLPLWLSNAKAKPFQPSGIVEPCSACYRAMCQAWVVQSEAVAC